jgi:hypothetical protein
LPIRNNGLPDNFQVQKAHANWLQGMKNETRHEAIISAVFVKTQQNDSVSPAQN